MHADFNGFIELQSVFIKVDPFNNNPVGFSISTELYDLHGDGAFPITTKEIPHPLAVLPYCASLLPHGNSAF
jgi:hypothetical protein